MTSGATSTSFGTANLEQTPAFTHDDENRERTTLTVQEILSIESDLHGITAGVAGLSVGGPLPSSSCSDANTYGEQSHKQDVSSILADEHTSPEVRAQLTAASASSIRALDDALAQLPQPQTLAYYEALLRCPEEITPEIKLQFLQREDFNAQLAAVRLALHWRLRLEYFTPHRAFLSMTLAGAMADDVQDMVQYSMHQLLPVTDTAGRAIIYADPQRMNAGLPNYKLEQEQRVMFYLCCVASQNPTMRQNGFVVLGDVHNLGRKQFHPKLAQTFGLMDQAFALRGRGAHFCHPSAVAYYLIAPVTKHVAGRFMRQRFLMHRGTTEEVLDILKGYCMPRNCVPTELGGDVKLDMVQWALDRMQSEDSKGTSMENSAATSSAAWATSDVNMQDQPDGEILGAPTPGSMYTASLGVASSFSSGPISRLVNDAADAGTGNVEQKRRTDSFDEALDEFDAVVSSAFVKDSSTPDIDDAADLGTKGLGENGLKRFTSQTPTGSLDSFDEAISELPGIGKGGVGHVVATSFNNRIRDNTGTPLTEKAPSKEKKRKIGTKLGNVSDPRMTRAVEIRMLSNNTTSLHDALVQGGFVFTENGDGELVDAEDGTKLSQRKNNLCRRIRLAKKQKEESEKKEA